MDDKDIKGTARMVKFQFVQDTNSINREASLVKSSKSPKNETKVRWEAVTKDIRFRIVGIQVHRIRKKKSAKPTCKVIYLYIHTYIHYTLKYDIMLASYYSFLPLFPAASLPYKRSPFSGTSTRTE